MAKTKIKCLFTDIGGVLLNNGWDRKKKSRSHREI